MAYLYCAPAGHARNVPRPLARFRPFGNQRIRRRVPAVERYRRHETAEALGAHTRKAGAARVEVRADPAMDADGPGVGDGEGEASATETGETVSARASARGWRRRREGLGDGVGVGEGVGGGASGAERQRRGRPLPSLAGRRCCERGQASPEEPPLVLTHLTSLLPVASVGRKVQRHGAAADGARQASESRVRRVEDVREGSCQPASRFEPLFVHFWRPPPVAAVPSSVTKSVLASLKKYAKIGMRPRRGETGQRCGTPAPSSSGARCRPCQCRGSSGSGSSRSYRAARRRSAGTRWLFGVPVTSTDVVAPSEAV
jgi:hypothetical protein